MDSRISKAFEIAFYTVQKTFMSRQGYQFRIFLFSIPSMFFINLFLLITFSFYQANSFRITVLLVSCSQFANRACLGSSVVKKIKRSQL